MTPDLEALVVAAYVFADEYPVPARPGPAAKVADAELVALAAAMGISSDRQFLGLVGYRLPGWFPCLPSQSQYNRRLRGLTGLLTVVQQRLARLLDSGGPRLADGTLIGVAHRAGLLDEEGNLPRMKQALVADSFAAMFGSLIGTSTTTSYIESTAGVAAGGRTGLTAVVVALLFLLALFFAPLAGMVPAYASAAALLYVACVMTRALAEIDWEDITEYAPAVVAAVTMPLTYSIATGIGLGFITYALAKLIAGRMAQAKPAVLILAAIFALKFALTG